MSVVYYYAKKEALPIYLKYGIRLSKNYDRELNINGYQKPYLIGLLNPHDDQAKMHSSDYACIKLDVLNNHLIVWDASISASDGIIKETTMIEKYIFGSYLKPRVLIDSSVISDKISLYNPLQDIPLLYDNSEEYYYQMQIQKKLEDYSYQDILNRLS